MNQNQPFALLVPITVFVGGCLLDRELYDRRRAALADLDGDGVPSLDAGGLDCDDTDPTVFPGAQELCNGRDDDCDGVVDDDPVDPKVWYSDFDGDGFGAEPSTIGCTAGSGYVTQSGDCDDRDSSIFLGATEVPYDGRDNDCVGGDQVDVDGDGFDAAEAGGDDCDDLDATVGPGATESWLNGGVDADCDGSLSAPLYEFGQRAWTGPSAGSWAGLGLAPLGDVSGDGLADFLVGAPFESSAYANGGAVYFVHGGDPFALSTLQAVQPGGPSIGFGVVEAGPDMTGDGTPEVAISGSLWDDGAGKVWLLAVDGWPDGDVPTIAGALASVEGLAAEDFVGTGMVFPGDITGDGLEDFVVSAAGASPETGWDNGGVIDIWTLAELGTGSVGDGDVSVGGYYSGAGYGKILQSAGDVDGDGTSDILVGASSGDMGVVVSTSSSEIDLVGDSLFRLTAFEGDETGRVQMIGDVDSDGVRDMAFVMDSGGNVLVYTNLRSGGVRTNSSPSFTIEVPIGVSIDTILGVGDIDHDGAEETAVLAHGVSSTGLSSVAIVLGAEVSFSGSMALDEAPLRAQVVRFDAGFGYRAVISADVTGDGYRDLLLGGPWDSVSGENAGAVVALPIP